MTAAARVTTGLKWPPLTAPKVMIKANSTNACVRPITAKSEPVWAAGSVETNNDTTVPMTNTRNSVPINSAM